MDMETVKSPSHRKVLVVLLVCVIVVSFVYILSVVLTPRQTTFPPNSLAARQALLAQPNPPANLTDSEISARQKLLNAPNPPSKLTPAQIKARQALMENI